MPIDAAAGKDSPQSDEGHKEGFEPPMNADERR
jgi:hypothetical protein